MTVKRRLEKVEQAVNPEKKLVTLEDMLRAIEMEESSKEYIEIMSRPIHPELEKALRDMEKDEPGGCVDCLKLGDD